MLILISAPGIRQEIFSQLNRLEENPFVLDGKFIQLSQTTPLATYDKCE